MNFYQEELERFFAKVDTSGGAGDCQPWDGATTPKGYGMFYPARFLALSSLVGGRASLFAGTSHSPSHS